MRSYLVTTGVLFALFCLAHLVRLVAGWHWPLKDPVFTGTVAAVAVLSGALSTWAFRILRSQRAAA